MLAFRLTVDNACLFFELCEKFNANTEAERVAILVEMSKFGQVESITETPKTKEEYVKHMAKHFKVLQVKSCTPQP